MINVDIRVNQTVNIDIEIDTVIEAINEEPITTRLNTIASLINGIDTNEFESLNQEKQNIVINYFEKKLTEFKAIQNS